MITVEEARAFERASENDIAAASALARDIRDRHWGRTVSYSRKVFIPLTTMCRNSCGYCVFVKQPGEPGATYLTPEQVLDIARKGERLGCKEALFSLGERPERRYPEAAEILDQLGFRTTIEYVIHACRVVLENTSLIPHVNAGTLRAAEIAGLREVSGSIGMMLETISKRLLKSGRAHHRCPDKVPLLRLRTLEEAGRQRVPFTTGILIGIGETWIERIESLFTINEIHKRYGHIQEVIVQNFRAKKNTTMSECLEPDLKEMLKTLAVARLILDPSISIQAPPNLESSYEDYIDYGINDWGGVSPLTVDHINPERAWPVLDDLRKRTGSKGHRLVERLTVYPKHLDAVPTALAGPIRAMAGNDGFAREQIVN